MNGNIYNQTAVQFISLFAVIDTSPAGPGMNSYHNLGLLLSFVL